MSLTTSYVVSLQTKKTGIGTTAGDKSLDATSSLKQAVNNVFEKGSSFTFDFELSSGETRVVNFPDLGVPYIRMLLLKSDFQFGYSLSVDNPSSAPWLLTRTAFIDFEIEAPALYTADTRFIKPTTVSITSPASTHPPLMGATIIVQLEVISYSL